MNQPLKSFRSDLHVHTVLSPCAEVEMIPPLIVESALDLGIDLIAITDHNSTANFKAVLQAAENSPLIVLPGVELQTREEVHCLCLFDNLYQIIQFQLIIDRSLPPFLNQPDHFGEQFIVDSTGEFLSREDRLLLTSTSLSLKEAFQLTNQLGGLFIPAHVDRKAFGLIETLGFVPTDVAIEAVEISRHLPASQASKTFPQLSGYPLIQNGDVHRLNEFLGSLVFNITSPTISEIRLALLKDSGRSFSISPRNNTL